VYGESVYYEFRHDPPATTMQVRAGQDEIVEAIVRLVEGTETWSQTSARLPKFEGQELE
jgi:glycyl-tRNA synthetase